MKQHYFLVMGLLLVGVSHAQLPFVQNNYRYAPGDKHAPRAISTVNGRTVSDVFDREIYYSENFDSGFGGWIDEIQEGPVGFELTSIGHENDPENTFQIPTLETTTPDQWVLLDSDGDGDGYDVSEAATLTSPMIDLSETAGSFVALTFEQFFAEWQPTETSDHCYVGVSTDGSSWTEIEINEGVGREARPNPEIVSWDITDLIEGEESTVWFRFRWDGAWNYGWQIDNVQVEDINESDLTIMDTYRTYDEGIVYSQVAQAHASEFIIGAIIRNIGHITQTNVKFEYVISGPGGTEVATGVSTAVIPAIASGEQDTILHETGYVPDELGSYTISWTAVADDPDDNMGDNSAEDDHFTLTEYTMALDYDAGPVYEIGNWPLKFGEAYFGNLMTFQSADVVTALQAKITNHSENLGEQIKAVIWEFPEGGTEWTYVFDTEDRTIIESDLGGFITFDMDEFPVNSTSTYLFCVYQYASSPMPIFERQGDIRFNNVQGRDDELANRGFFDRAAPIVRVRLHEGEVDVKEEEVPEVFSIYPNPANEFIYINLALNQSENIVLNLMDISGKIIQTRNLGPFNGSTQVNLDLAELSEGVYFVELITDSGKQVKKVVKK